MLKGCSFLMAGLLLIIAVPICIGIAGGAFGLFFGLIGGAIGLFFSIIGGIFEFIGWIFSSIMHLLFGWHHHGFHPFHFHFNGFLILALIVLVFALSQRKK